MFPTVSRARAMRTCLPLLSGDHLYDHRTQDESTGWRVFSAERSASSQVPPSSTLTWTSVTEPVPDHAKPLTGASSPTRSSLPSEGLTRIASGAISAQGDSQAPERMT